MKHRIHTPAAPQSAKTEHSPLPVELTLALSDLLAVLLSLQFLLSLHFCRKSFLVTFRHALGWSWIYRLFDGLLRLLSC